MSGLPTVTEALLDSLRPYVKQPDFAGATYTSTQRVRMASPTRIFVSHKT